MHSKIESRNADETENDPPNLLEPRIVSVDVPSSKNIKSECTPEEEIKEYAESAMNEVLGWFGYDKIERAETRLLNLQHFTTPRPQVANAASSSAEADSSGVDSFANSPRPVDSGNACTWCGKAMDSSDTSTYFKPKLCSEPCFLQSRRAAFKGSRRCEWCQFVRPPAVFAETNGGRTLLAFCTTKCMNHYKMNIFCSETQAHLDMNPHLQADKTTANLITPDLWLRNSKSKSLSPPRLPFTTALSPNRDNLGVPPAMPPPMPSAMPSVMPSRPPSPRPPPRYITVAPPSKLLKPHMRSTKPPLSRKRKGKCPETVTKAGQPELHLNQFVEQRIQQNLAEIKAMKQSAMQRAAKAPPNIVVTQIPDWPVQNTPPRESTRKNYAPKRYIGQLPKVAQNMHEPSMNHMDLREQINTLPPAELLPPVVVGLPPTLSANNPSETPINQNNQAPLQKVVKISPMHRTPPQELQVRLDIHKSDKPGLYNMPNIKDYVTINMPTTTLVPYPVVCPFPLPVPIPIPITDYIYAVSRLITSEIEYRIHQQLHQQLEEQPEQEQHQELEMQLSPTVTQVQQDHGEMQEQQNQQPEIQLIQHLPVAPMQHQQSEMQQQQNQQSGMHEIQHSPAASLQPQHLEIQGPHQQLEMQRQQHQQSEMQQMRQLPVAPLQLQQLEMQRQQQQQFEMQRQQHQQMEMQRQQHQQLEMQRLQHQQSEIQHSQHSSAVPLKLEQLLMQGHQHQQHHHQSEMQQTHHLPPHPEHQEMEMQHPHLHRIQQQHLDLHQIQRSPLARIRRLQHQHPEMQPTPYQRLQLQPTNQEMIQAQHPPIPEYQLQHDQQRHHLIKYDIQRQGNEQALDYTMTPRNYVNSSNDPEQYQRDAENYEKMDLSMPGPSVVITSTVQGVIEYNKQERTTPLCRSPHLRITGLPDVTQHSPSLKEEPSSSTSGSLMLQKQDGEPKTIIPTSTNGVASLLEASRILSNM